MAAPSRILRGAWGITPVTQISPRASVLITFAGSRVAAYEPLPEMGYAFVFFYGLERRLIVEQRDRGPDRGRSPAAHRDVSDIWLA